jgi:hypothetical protein
MIINIPYDFDREAQKELCARLVIKDNAVKDIVLKHLYSLDYYERQAWIKENAMHREEITEDQL